MGYPVFPKPFIEETILSSLCLLGTLAIYWLCGGYFWTLVFSIVLCVSLLPRWIVIKNPTDNAEDEGLILGSGRSSEEGNGNPLQYSCPDNPMGRSQSQRWLSTYVGWCVSFVLLMLKHCQKLSKRQHIIVWVFVLLNCQGTLLLDTGTGNVDSKLGIIILFFRKTFVQRSKSRVNKP